MDKSAVTQDAHSANPAVGHPAKELLPPACKSMVTIALGYLLMPACGLGALLILGGTISLYTGAATERHRPPRLGRLLGIGVAAILTIPTVVVGLVVAKQPPTQDTIDLFLFAWCYLSAFTLLAVLLMLPHVIAFTICRASGSKMLGWATILVASVGPMIAMTTATLPYFLLNALPSSWGPQGTDPHGEGKLTTVILAIGLGILVGVIHWIALPIVLVLRGRASRYFCKASELLVQIDRKGRIDADLPCVQCGYNLRTQSPKADCPECGHPIPRSLDSSRSVLMPPSN